MHINNSNVLSDLIPHVPSLAYNNKQTMISDTYEVS